MDTNEKITEARTGTARAIAHYAAKKYELEQARANRSAPSEVIYDAAQAFRQAEKNMHDAIQQEVVVLTELAVSQAQTPSQTGESPVG